MDSENLDLYIRTVSDSKIVINHAKLTEDELCPITQTIYLSDELKSYKLFEIPDNILNEIQQGEKVVFRGDLTDSVVMCTQSKTFEVKEAETSNSLNLIPNLIFPDHSDMKIKQERQLIRQNIEGIYYTYLEIKPCKPKFGKLNEILNESVYVDHIIENKYKNDTRKLYKFEDLLNIIQSSEEELCYQLKQRNAGSIKGYIRILEHDYNFRMLSHILNLIDSNSWSPDQIDYEETRDTLKDLIPKDVLNFIFEHYTTISEKSNDNGYPYHSLIEDKVCRTIGEALLKPTEKFSLDEFLKVWQASVPEGFKTNLKQLEGLAFVKKSNTLVVIQYFPEINLSEDIKTRIDQLFQVQDKWTLNDIKPYIECLASEKLNVNALLTKYARPCNDNGVRYFSSRLGK